MELKSYLDRIHYDGDLTSNLATLNAIQRAHLLNIPYENLDIHLGCPVTTDLEQIYDKIVTNHRGGWCFEMNGLLAWALREVGFDVTLLSSYVGRTEVTETGVGDHLILLVKLDKPYLADVGFGNGFLEPLPLAEGTYSRGFLSFALAQKDGRWWFTNHIYGGAGYDFDLKPYQLSDFAGQSTRLQTSPDSGFVKTTVCMRFMPDGGTVILRGAVLRKVDAEGEHDKTVESEAEYTQVLNDEFDLRLPNTDALWEEVWARHQVWLKKHQ